MDGGILRRSTQGCFNIIFVIQPFYTVIALDRSTLLPHYDRQVNVCHDRINTSLTNRNRRDRGLRKSRDGTLSGQDTEGEPFLVMRMIRSPIMQYYITYMQ
jgi:hypothetical protein